MSVQQDTRIATFSLSRDEVEKYRDWTECVAFRFVDREDGTHSAGCVMTRDEQIERLEQLGHIAPDCPGCKCFYEAENPARVFAPDHKPSPRCASGGRPHCTCDTCF